MREKPKIFVIKTSPDTVLKDYAQLMHIAEYQKYYTKEEKIILKLNLSWSKFFPACSTPPWQVEGVLKTMVPEGFKIPLFYFGKSIIHLPTMKTHGHTGQRGGSLKHTMGTSKHGGITCAMKNAFGGLLTKRRHFSHQYLSEVLVDLLIIQKQIHPNILAVVDGTVCGDGAGPRTMIPRIKNYLLAGYDQVAVDAVVSHMLG